MSSDRQRPIIYRVKIWRRASNELEPAEDYFAHRSLCVGDVVDLWHDSQPRNFRVCSVMNGEIVVGEDSIPAIRSAASPGLLGGQMTSNERIVSDRGCLYRMSERSFVRYLTEGAKTGSVNAASYGKQIGDVDFYATGVNRLEFEYKLKEVNRTAPARRHRDTDSQALSAHSVQSMQSEQAMSRDADPSSLKP